jgi:acyl-CoA synthetase (AMP-forming)/AMP-acid ligase II
MVLASRYTSRPIPDTSLARLFRDAAEAHGDQLAVVDGPTGRSYTFRQLLDQSASVAHGLIARGIAPGDRVAFICPNLPEVALAYHGVIAAGAVAMMVNPLSTSDELAKYFRVGSPRLAIVAAPLVAAIRSVAPGLPVIAMGDAPGIEPDTEPFSALLGGSAVPPEVAVAPDAVAVMPYSSGTTGFPKGVMLTHRNVIAQCLAIESVTDGDVIVPGAPVLAVLPFFHIYGIMAFLTFGLMRGARLITMPRFDLEQYVQLARRHEVPLLHLVPPILLGLAKYPGELQLPHLRAALVGAAPLSAELAAEFTRRTGAMVYQVYGMTEVAGASHLGSRDPARNKPGSIGSLIGSAEARVVSTETAADVAPGETGEIWVRGPFVMKGYFEDPEATALTIDRDGWLHTGDIGHVDADGDFWVVDRVKELIKYKGLQVAPAELEAVLLQHPAVADCAVYPQDDAEAGEIPKAAVVLKRDTAATSDELLQFVQARVSPHKRLRALRFVDAIPKSASGKILRRVLVAQDRARSPG